jgi:hypothetical protein
MKTTSIFPTLLMCCLLSACFYQSSKSKIIKLQVSGETLLDSIKNLYPCQDVNIYGMVTEVNGVADSTITVALQCHNDSNNADLEQVSWVIAQTVKRALVASNDFNIFSTKFVWTKQEGFTGSSVTKTFNVYREQLK